MEYKTEFGFKKAIIVDEVMIRDICEVVQKYCERIEWSSELENGDKIKFKSVDELLAFENSKVYAIKSIHIVARDGDYENRIDICVDSDAVLLSKGSKTVSVEMTTDSLEKKRAFKSRMEEIVERHEQGRKYNAVSKSGIFNVVTIMYVLITLIFLCDFISNGFEIRNYNLFWVFFFLSVAHYAVEFFRRLQKKYYPPVVFYFGDGISIYDSNEKARENFFWGVVVASILGVIFLVLEIYLN